MWTKNQIKAYNFPRMSASPLDQNWRMKPLEFLWKYFLIQNTVLWYHPLFTSLMIDMLMLRIMLRNNLTRLYKGMSHCDKRKVVGILFWPWMSNPDVLSTLSLDANLGKKKHATARGCKIYMREDTKNVQTYPIFMHFKLIIDDIIPLSLNCICHWRLKGGACSVCQPPDVRGF